MRYRNIVTGAEFESNSVISAPDWVTVGADNNPPHKNDQPKEEPPAPPKATKEKTVTQKSAPKKAKKGARK